MDKEGFPLAAMREQSDADQNGTPNKSKTSERRAPLRPAMSDASMENGYASINVSLDSPKRSSNPPASRGKLNATTDPPEDTAVSRKSKFKQVEMVSIPDEDDDDDDDDDDDGQESGVGMQRPSQRTTDPDTMISSFTTGGESDVVEIHQFSLLDIDVYLDIYFETLENRLRRHIGTEDQVRQFRADMKTRISNVDDHCRKTASDRVPFLLLQFPILMRVNFKMCYSVKLMARCLPL